MQHCAHEGNLSGPRFDFFLDPLTVSTRFSRKQWECFAIEGFKDIFENSSLESFDQKK